MKKDILTTEWSAFFRIARPRAIRCSCDELRRLAAAARMWASWCERLAAAGEPSDE